MGRRRNPEVVKNKEDGHGRRALQAYDVCTVDSPKWCVSKDVCVCDQCGMLECV
jgi:hypothetical protein